LYNYNIKNSGSSKQVLEAFSIFLRDTSFYSKTIESPIERKWYIDGLSKTYITGAAAGNTLDLPSENGLLPGESMNISFTSYGLPAIHPFYTQGFVRPWTEEYLDSLFEAGYKREEMFLGWKKEWFQGITVSPKIWPEETSFSVPLDTLETFRYRSCEELNWVTNHGVCNSLEVKIRNVKRHIERGKTKQAENVLNAFLNEVKAQRGKHITEEGYALLYYNAEYLRDQLNKGKEE
jgi:hypothetical protein